MARIESDEVSTLSHVTALRLLQRVDGAEHEKDPTGSGGCSQQLDWRGGSQAHIAAGGMEGER